MRLTCPSYDPHFSGSTPVLTRISDAGEHRLELRIVAVSTKGADDRASQRHVGPCLQGGCENWQDARCRVSDHVAQGALELTPTWRIEQCELRPTCRWFAQNSFDACGACAYVAEDRF